jgi:hypothetical protein
MTDRELLEKAAKAAGLTFKGVTVLQNPPEMYVFTREQGRWNPLAYDAQALRLAVRLNLDIFTNDGDGGHTSVGGGTDVFVQEKHGTDPIAATRRAIVRAAAALADSASTTQGKHDA